MRRVQHFQSSEAKDLGIGCRAPMEILRFAQDDGSWRYTTPHCGRSPTGMLCHHTSSKVSGRQGEGGEGGELRERSRTDIWRKAKKPTRERIVHRFATPLTPLPCPLPDGNIVYVRHKCSNRHPERSEGSPIRRRHPIPRSFAALRMTGFAVMTKMKNVASGEREVGPREIRNCVSGPAPTIPPHGC